MQKPKYCFGDFEYSCLDKTTNDGLPIISIGIVICDSKLHFMDSFYKTIKPLKNEILSERCKKLTGLTQEEIDSSKDFDIVCAECLDFINKYNLDNILIWGQGDHISVKYDFKLHREQGLPYSNIKLLKKRMKDIEPYLMKKVNLHCHIGLQRLQKMFAIKANDLVKHNALDDAILLSRLFYVLTRTNLNNKHEYQEYLIKIAKKKQLNCKK